MDITSVFGLVGAFSVIILGILTAVQWEIPQAVIFLDIASVFIVVGASAFAVTLSTDKNQLKATFKVVKNVFKSKVVSYDQLINDFRRFAEVARKEGVLALDNLTNEIKDPFLIRAIQLAVDGVDPNVIEQLLTLEAEQVSERHEEGIGVLRRLASYAPSFGMIGTLVGLVVMLKNLSDPNLIGPSMAVAILTTLYGALIAYLFAIPMADKLDIKNKQELLEKQLVIKGMISIQSGDNPRMVVQKLKLFLPPKLREAIK